VIQSNVYRSLVVCRRGERQKPVLLGIRIRTVVIGFRELNGLENGGERNFCSDSHITYIALRGSG
jgi:hypothetical protein